MRNIFKLRIRTKIFIAFLCLSLFSLLLFGYIAFTNMKELGEYASERSESLGSYAVNDSISALRKQAEEYLQKLAVDQAAIANALLEKVEDEVSIIVNFASNLWGEMSHEGHRKSYSQEEKPDDIYAVSVYTLAPQISIDEVGEELNISSNMDEIYIPVFSNDRNIDTICLGTETGIFRSYPWRGGRDPSYDPRKREWYKEAVSAREIIWTEPYIHAATKELVITCAKPFYDRNKNLLGVVEADVTLNVLNEKIVSTQIGDLGYAFLIDDKGDIIARPGLSSGDTRWDETYKTENLFESANKELNRLARKMISGKDGIFVCNLEECEKYVAYAPLKTTNWFLGIVMPVNEIISPALLTKKKIVSATKNTTVHINKRIKSVLLILCYAFFTVILIVLFLDYFISKKITKPILELNKGVKIIGSGNLDYHINISTGDEIGALADTFNKMTDDLKRHIKNLQETTAVKERMQSELRIAHEIQMSLVPKIFPPFPERPEFDIYAILKPAKEVGGDLYDFFFIDPDHFCFVVGDVSGKGVPASLFMAVVKTLVKTTAKEVKNPSEILNRVNKEIAHDNKSGLFITLFCGILNVKTGEVNYTNAGHNHPFLVCKGKDPEALKKAGGTVIGVMENISYDSEKVILEPGDSIYMYTDGVTEAVNSQQERFLEERLKKELYNSQHESIKDVVVKTLQAVESFTVDMAQSDDITILLLRYFQNGR